MGRIQDAWNALIGKKIPEPKEVVKENVVIPPTGRVSAPNDEHGTTWGFLQGQYAFVKPSYRKEVIPIIRKLYKVNPDISLAIQDLFKLANTEHLIEFPNDEDETAAKLSRFLRERSKKWSSHTAGVYGIINKMITQLLIGGAISIEGVPSNKIDGIATVVFINPDDILFRRSNNGVYQPYQVNKSWLLGSDSSKKGSYIKLNLATYKYVSWFNDTDEPYGIPPFMAVLESIATQVDMKVNINNIMTLAGMLGFMEAKVEKPDQRGNEGEHQYGARLNHLLKETKQNIRKGMKDGLVVGFKEDHEFKFNSTTKDLSNLSEVWNINQQSVANGLGGQASLIGVEQNKTAGGASIMLSKMVSQLRNLQELVSSTLEFLYSLELQLAGIQHSGIKVRFTSSTISDEVKLQQGLEIKIRNNQALYDQGLLSQLDYARNMGIEYPDMDEPRAIVDSANTIDPVKKQKVNEKDARQERRQRDKNNPQMPRRDGQTKPV